MFQTSLFMVFLNVGKTDIQFLSTIKPEQYSFTAFSAEMPSLFCRGLWIPFLDVILTTQETSLLSSVSLCFPVTQKDDFQP